MITIKTTLITDAMKDLALSNCVGTPIEANNTIVFEMTDRMFKPFFQQAQCVLGYSNVNDDNFTFKFHNDMYPLLDWK